MQGYDDDQATRAAFHDLKTVKLVLEKHDELQRDAARAAAAAAAEEEANAADDDGDGDEAAPSPALLFRPDDMDDDVRSRASSMAVSDRSTGASIATREARSLAEDSGADMQVDEGAVKRLHDDYKLTWQFSR